MKKICEGNLYNIEDEISHQPQPSITGLESWKEQVKKDLYQKLLQGQIKDLDPIIQQVFGKTLE